MIDLEAIKEDCEKDKGLRNTLEDYHAPDSTIRYYDGMIKIYESILKGDYDKK